MGVGLLVLALAGGGLTAWLVTRDGADDRPTAHRSGGLEVVPAAIDRGVSVLGEPGRVWDFDPSTVEPTATLSPMSPISYQPMDDVLRFGDLLLVQVTPEEGASRLVAVDTGTEKVAWTFELAEHGSDCHLPDPRHLYCNDGKGRLVHLDPADGSVLGAHAADAWVSLQLRGKVLYALSAGGPGKGRHPALLTAYDAESLDQQWTLPLDDSLGIGDDGENDFDGGVVLGTDDGELVAGYGPLQWQVDPATRRVLGQSENRGEDGDAEEDGYRVEWSEEHTTVRDASGRTVLGVDGDPWYGDGAGGYIRDGLIGAGSGVYDLDTGEAVWTRPDLAGYDEYGTAYDWSWALDRRNVVVEGSQQDASTGTSDGTLLDGRTGRTVLTLSDKSAPMLRTDDAVVVVSDGEVAAHDATTGEPAWSRPAPGEFSAVLALGDALVVEGSSGLVVLSDFPAVGGSGKGATEEAGDEGGTAYRTACGKPPTFVPTASRAANGGITITYRVTATCGGGQWLNDSQLSVPFTVAGTALASGWFDFSEDPYWIPDDGTDLQLVYPFENTQAPESDIADAIEQDGGTGKVVTVPCEPGPDSVGGAVPSDPRFGGDPDEATVADGTPEEDSAADRDESALEALQRIAREDRTAVEALGTSWTAQLSSKKPGTADDGIVYDSYDDILALHLRHRARYPDALLAFSTDWPGSFGPSSRGYWVTLSGQSEATTAPVLRWCTDEGWGPGDCWAKRLATTGDPDANTDRGAPDERNN